MKKRFIDLPRNKKADMAFQVKKDIEESPYSYYSNTQYDLNPTLQYDDITFISKKDKHIFYNTSIITSGIRYYDTKLSNAHSEIKKLMNNGNEIDHDTIEFEETGNGYSILKPVVKNYNSLGNISKREFVKKYTQEYDFDVFEEFKLDYSYKYGIGLDMVIDTEFLTPDIITLYINAFLANGETNFKSNNPCVNFDKIKAKSYVM